MIKKVFIILIIPALVNSGCREEFMPEVNKYEDLLVVDGMITNEPGPYQITLSRSSSVNKPDFQPLSGCTVEITEENSGNSIGLTERDEPGVYMTPENGFQAKAGEAYKLSIITPGNEHYESDFIEMPEPVGIDTSHAELEFHESNEYPRPLGGYRFYITTKNAPEEKTYFLWRLSETYEYTANFRIQYIYRGRGIEPFTKRDSLYRCWKTQNVPEFFVGTTQGLSEPRIRKEPLHYISTETKRLQERYSWEVKQYSISQEAYNFWKVIREQTASDDFLFSSQPYQVRGNVYNVDDTDKAVMGFFTVASVTRERFFVDRPSAEFFYSECVTNPDLMALAYMPPERFPVYLTNTNEGIAFAAENCFDCTLAGGKLKKPDFWREGDN